MIQQWTHDLYTALYTGQWTRCQNHLNLLIVYFLKGADLHFPHFATVSFSKRWKLNRAKEATVFVVCKFLLSHGKGEL